MPATTAARPTARLEDGTPTPVNPADVSAWDDRVLAHRDGSIFHSAAWARVLQATYGFQPLYFTSHAACRRRREETQSLGRPGSQSLLTSAPAVLDPNAQRVSEDPRLGLAVLPLMEVDSWLTGRRGVALPFTDECELLYAEAEAARQLFRNALEFGRSRGWKSMEIRGGRRLFPEAPVSLSFYGHRLKLDSDPGRMFGRLDSSVRRAIRKAEKNGVTVSVSRDLAAMKTFYGLQCQTRRKHGLPPQPFTFFRNIWEHLLCRDLGMVAIARSGKRAIAASVYFQLGTRAVYKYGASDESCQQLRGSNLVMWEAIKSLARQGARTLSLGRTSIGQEGLRRFKLGWGAGEYPIEYLKYDLRKGAFVEESDEATGWYNRVFRLLPVSLSRLVGAALYRHWG